MIDCCYYRYFSEASPTQTPDNNNYQRHLTTTPVQLIQTQSLDINPTEVGHQPREDRSDNDKYLQII